MYVASFYGPPCEQNLGAISNTQILAIGLKAFGEYLAEDDVIGQALGKRYLMNYIDYTYIQISLYSGYKLALSTKLAVQNSGAPSTMLFRERIIRYYNFVLIILLTPSPPDGPNYEQTCHHYFLCWSQSQSVFLTLSF